MTFLGRTDQHSVLQGAAYVLLGTLFFTVADTYSKFLSQTFSVLLVVWARYAIPLLMLLLAWKFGKFSPRLGLQRWRVHLIRGLLLLAATLFIVSAMKKISLANAQTISFVHPIALTLLAALLLKETVETKQWLAILIGFFGILLIIRPTLDGINVYSLLPLGMAVCYAFYQILTRLVAQHEAPESALFYVMATGTFVTSFFIPYEWSDMDIMTAFSFVVMGAASGLGHLCMTQALKTCQASQIAPFTYVQLIWATVAGIWIFGDYPDMWNLAGMSLVVIAGMWVLRTHRIRHRDTRTT